MGWNNSWQTLLDGALVELDQQACGVQCDAAQTATKSFNVFINLRGVRHILAKGDKLVKVSSHDKKLFATCTVPDLLKK